MTITWIHLFCLRTDLNAVLDAWYARLRFFERRIRIHTVLDVRECLVAAFHFGAILTEAGKFPMSELLGDVLSCKFHSSFSGAQEHSKAMRAGGESIKMPAEILTALDRIGVKNLLW